MRTPASIVLARRFAAACFAVLPAAVLTPAAPAQAPRADSHTSQSAHSSSHRVVVVDGKTVVDETIVDGKQVRSGGGGGAGGGLPPGIDPEAMLRELRARMPDVGHDLPPVGKDAPSKSSAHASSSSTHHVVVENGKTVVDEATGDGKPVPAGASGGDHPAARGGLVPVRGGAGRADARPAGAGRDRVRGLRPRTVRPARATPEPVRQRGGASPARTTTTTRR